MDRIALFAISICRRDMVPKHRDGCKSLGDEDCMGQRGLLLGV
jgi:hypothetical protein